VPDTVIGKRKAESLRAVNLAFFQDEQVLGRQYDFLESVKIERTWHKKVLRARFSGNQVGAQPSNGTRVRELDFLEIKFG
jgi:hypothetical protein